MNLVFLTSSFDARLVALSVIVAVLSSFVALDLARRVHSADQASSRYWLAGGSLAMGTGIWSMHFVAMLAFSLPIRLGYDIAITTLSWVAGVGASWIALSVARHSKPEWKRIGGGALAMGAGICMMHYTGMAAMQITPGIEWNYGWVAISALIAVAASFTALTIFFLMRTQEDRAAPQLDPTWCAVVIGGAAISMLAVTLVASILDARLQSRTAVLVTSLKEANQELQMIALLDNLTKLPNRLLLSDRLEQAVGRSRRSGNVIALLFVDLDGFKTVNDSLGHPVGDQVLQAIAARLNGIVRESDTVARIGGDEFVVLVEAVEDRTALALMAERIERAVRMPISLNDDEVQLSASIGIAVFPDDALDENQLLAHADAAMYSAKSSGKNTHRFHDPATTVSAAGLMADLRDLRQALQRQEFELYYQPKLSPDGSEMVGVEALIRWRHPQRGLVLPNHFIPIAERFGLIAEIGSWVLDEGCRQMREWQDQGWTVPMAINLAAQQIRQPDLVTEIEQTLARYKLNPGQLTLELTESQAMDDASQTLELLNRLEQIGVKIAIDDFGTGYSSLSYLRRFHVNELKIDGSFVRDVEHSEDARSIVAAVVQLAHSLNLRVVAEGVENLKQSEFLSSMKCDELQGYYYSRPVPASELEHRLRSRGAGEEFRATGT
jgi:diguanylate cyclase (GGDEF)-like protein